MRELCKVREPVHACATKMYLFPRSRLCFSSSIGTLPWKTMGPTCLDFRKESFHLEVLHRIWDGGALLRGRQVQQSVGAASGGGRRALAVRSSNKADADGHVLGQADLIGGLWGIVVWDLPFPSPAPWSGGRRLGGWPPLLC